MRAGIFVFSFAVLFTTPAASQKTSWEQMAHMQLERQFAGPLKDTIIQRWRDPVDGMICYIYLPISTQHSAPMQEGFVQYGANSIGSLSCFAPGGAGPARSSVSQPGKEAGSSAPAKKSP